MSFKISKDQIKDLKKQLREKNIQNATSQKANVVKYSEEAIENKILEKNKKSSIWNFAEGQIVKVKDDIDYKQLTKLNCLIIDDFSYQTNKNIEHGDIMVVITNFHKDKMENEPRLKQLNLNNYVVCFHENSRILVSADILQIL
jgi:hypothetical protein